MLKTKIFKLLSVLLIIGMIFGCTPVFAETGDTQDDGTGVEETTDDGTADDETTDDGTIDDGTAEETTDPGLTPDDILYVFDRLFEDIHLALTFDEAKKASLLLSISSERIAEAAYLITIAETGEIDQEEWNTLFQDVVDDYQAKIDDSIEAIEEAYDVDKVSQETMDQLIEDIITSVDFDIERLNENEQIGEVRDKALLVANVISGLNTEQVAVIRALGVGYGQISQIFALAEASDKSVDEVAALFTEEGMGLGTAKKVLGVEASDLAKLKKTTKGNEAVDDTADDNTDDATDDNNTDNQNNGTEFQLNEQNQNNGEDSQIQANNQVKTNNGNVTNNSATNSNSNTNKDKVKSNNNSNNNDPTTVDENNDDTVENNNSNNNGNSNKDNTTNNGKK